MINKFGRLQAPPDARDRDYPMSAAMAQIKAVAKPAPRKTAYRDGPLLDQGDTPQCVGFSTRGFLDGAPLMTKGGPSAIGIYKGAQALDEWPGTNYDGTSVRGAMKFLSSLGVISSYVWGQTVADAVAWMNGGYGTCLVGTNWYAEMSDVDSKGFMREPAASMTTPIGGHAWRLIWYDAKKGGVLMRNSWGPYFGLPKHGVPSGYAYVRTAFLERLLLEDGEVASPTEVKVKALVP